MFGDSRSSSLSMSVADVLIGVAGLVLASGEKHICPCAIHTCTIPCPCKCHYSFGSGALHSFDLALSANQADHFEQLRIALRNITIYLSVITILCSERECILHRLITGIWLKLFTSRPCDENVGCMAGQPADSCFLDHFGYCG